MLIVASTAAPPTSIATITAPPTTSATLPTVTFSSTTVSAAPPTDSLPTTSTTQSVVSKISSITTSISTATPIAESAAPPITESAAPPTPTSVVCDSAHQCLKGNVVKGPAGMKFHSFKEANDFYMDNNFPGWQKDSKTYVIPPVYKIHSEEIPNERIFQNEGMEATDRHSQLAEEQILNAFVNYGYHNAQPMFIFHRFDFERLNVFGKDQQKGMSSESDLIIVHRKIGIILVETKSMEKFSKQVYKKSKKQLNEAEEYLKTNEYFKLAQYATKVPVFKVIACPKLKRNPSQSDKTCGEYIDLRMNDISNFVQWWRITIASARTNSSILKLCNSVYCSLIPKLLCGRDDICVSLDIKKIAIKLDCQESLRKLVMKGPCTSKIARKWIYLTPE